MSIEEDVEETVNKLPVAEILDVDDILELLDTELLSLEGSASDPDGEIVSMEWSSDIDGELGTGATLEISAGELALGDHTITFTATDNDGATGSDSVDLTIEEKNNESPVAEILSLDGGEILLETDELILKGSGSDEEDGTLDGESLDWSSDIDGELGTGSPLDVTGELSTGDHTITLTATDSKGATGSDEITITVNLAPPTNLTAEEASLTTVQLTWQDNSDNETRFKVEQRLVGDDDSFILLEDVEIGEDTTSVEITGLDAGLYEFRVYAENSSGASDYSNTVEVDLLK